jgi:hypothetical protein
MEEMNVPINDFYGSLASKLNLTRDDHFHWQGEVYEMPAKTVVKRIHGNCR